MSKTNKTAEVLAEAARRREEDDKKLEALSSPASTEREFQRGIVEKQLRFIQGELAVRVDEERDKCECKEGCTCVDLRIFEHAEIAASAGIGAINRGDYESAAFQLSYALHAFAFPYLELGIAKAKADRKTRDRYKDARQWCIDRAPQMLDDDPEIRISDMAVILAEQWRKESPEDAPGVVSDTVKGWLRHADNNGEIDIRQARRPGRRRKP